MGPMDLRQLGKLEQYSSSRHFLGFHTCIINTCEYSIPRSIQKSERLRVCVTRALQEVICNIPSLQACIKDEASRQPTFVCAPSVSLSKHIAWSQSISQDRNDHFQYLTQRLEKELTKGFSNVEKQPPWRVVCIEPQIASGKQSTKGSAVLYLLFAVHHAISDGMSTKMFHEAFLHALNGCLTDAGYPGPDEDTISFSDTPQLPPALESKLKLSISWPFFLRTLWKEFGPKWLGGYSLEQSWTGLSYSSTTKQTNVRLVTVSAESLSGVLQACRARKTTLTPLIHAVILHAMTKNLRDGDATAFTAQTPLNLRPYFEDRAEEGSTSIGKTFGNYVTSVAHRFDRSVVRFVRDRSFAGHDAEVLWKVAATISADLDAQRMLIPNDDIVGLLPYISDFHAHFKGKLGKPRDTTWEISNIGSFSTRLDKNDSKGSCDIIQSIFTQPGHITGPAFSANISGVQSQGITISLCWQEGVVSTELMAAVADHIETALHMISNDAKQTEGT